VNRCLCSRHAVSPRCPRHGWGWRGKLGILALVAYLIVLVLAVLTAPAEAVVVLP